MWDTPAFQDVVRQGAALADAGAVVTFGITPDSPETGYGYIQSGAALGQGSACKIARFVEKPDLATAQSYLDAGSYLWNSGLFMMRASIWLAAIGVCRDGRFRAMPRRFDRLIGRHHQQDRISAVAHRRQRGQRQRRGGIAPDRFEDVLLHGCRNTLALSAGRLVA